MRQDWPVKPGAGNACPPTTPRWCLERSCSAHGWRGWCPPGNGSRASLMGCSRALICPRVCVPPFSESCFPHKFVSRNPNITFYFAILGAFFFAPGASRPNVEAILLMGWGWTSILALYKLCLEFIMCLWAFRLSQKMFFSAFLLFRSAVDGDNTEANCMPERDPESDEIVDKVTNKQVWCFFESAIANASLCVSLVPAVCACVRVRACVHACVCLPTGVYVSHLLPKFQQESWGCTFLLVRPPGDPNLFADFLYACAVPPPPKAHQCPLPPRDGQTLSHWDFPAGRIIK